MTFEEWWPNSMAYHAEDKAKDAAFAAWCYQQSKIDELKKKILTDDALITEALTRIGEITTDALKAKKGVERFHER